MNIHSISVVDLFIKVKGKKLKTQSDIFSSLAFGL